MGDAKKLPPEPYELNETTTKEIPERLRKTPGFVEAWENWVECRAEEKTKRGKILPVSARAAKMQLKALNRESDPVAYLDRAVEKNWEGLNLEIPLPSNGHHKEHKRTVQL